jgi:hypothetical protein
MNNVDYIWSVFVGGTEVNDNYMRLAEANLLAQEYVDDGYDQVVLMDTEGNEIIVKE